MFLQKENSSLLCPLKACQLTGLKNFTGYILKPTFFQKCLLLFEKQKLLGLFLTTKYKIFFSKLLFGGKVFNVFGYHSTL